MKPHACATQDTGLGGPGQGLDHDHGQISQQSSDSDNNGMISEEGEVEKEKNIDRIGPNIENFPKIEIRRIARIGSEGISEKIFLENLGHELWKECSDYIYQENMKRTENESSSNQLMRNKAAAGQEKNELQEIIQNSRSLSEINGQYFMTIHWLGLDYKLNVEIDTLKSTLRPPEEDLPLERPALNKPFYLSKRVLKVATLDIDLNILVQGQNFFKSLPSHSEKGSLFFKIKKNGTVHERFFQLTSDCRFIIWYGSHFTKSKARRKGFPFSNLSDTPSRTLEMSPPKWPTYS